MKIICDERCAEYSHPGHPERPHRITDTLKRLRAQQELAITWEKPDLVEDASLLRAHTDEHLARLQEAKDFDEDTPFYPRINDYARSSAGAAMAALRFAKGGDSVFSLMRPPGHHATKRRAMGFCYVNNAAVVALDALSNGSKRVAVFDFDVHHGNGTEAILLNIPGTTFYSIHQFPCYPDTGARNVGENCFNFPAPPQTPRVEYRHILDSAIEHMGSLRPDLVTVSAGFDAYARDPLAQETLEAEDFYWLGKRLRNLGVPIVSLLEGGYSEDLPDLILSYLKGLEGK